MQYAKLWKRILNHGLFMVGDTFPMSKETLERIIIEATIIVNPRPIPATAARYDFSKVKALPMPYDRIWVEGEVDDGSLWGALMWSSLEGLSGESGNKSKLIQVWTCVCVKETVVINPSFEILVSDHAEILEIGVDLEREYSPGMTTAEIIKIGFQCPFLLGCALDVITLLGCKNVGLAPHENDPHAVYGARRKYGPKKDNYRYHTLVVRPPGAKHDVPAQEIDVMPLHKCRGHFAEYGEAFGKGRLFGKYEGRFYVPPCLKGKRENGIVEKDYLIKPIGVTPSFKKELKDEQ